MNDGDEDEDESWFSLADHMLFPFCFKKKKKKHCWTPYPFPSPGEISWEEGYSIYQSFYKSINYLSTHRIKRDSWLITTLLYIL